LSAHLENVPDTTPVEIWFQSLPPRRRGTRCGGSLRAKWRTRAEAKAAQAEALRVVDCWNRDIRMGCDVWWSPTIRCAIVASTP
jgi:hypothetical protein